VEGEEIIARPQVNHILKYFLLKWYSIIREIQKERR
jgi:hypothetical protein